MSVREENWTCSRPCNASGVPGREVCTDKTKPRTQWSHSENTSKGYQEHLMVILVWFWNSICSLHTLETFSLVPFFSYPDIQHPALHEVALHTLGSRTFVIKTRSFCLLIFFKKNWPLPPCTATTLIFKNGNQGKTLEESWPKKINGL